MTLTYTTNNGTVSESGLPQSEVNHRLNTLCEVMHGRETAHGMVVTFVKATGPDDAHAPALTFRRTPTTSSVLTASALRDLAQYLLSASVKLQRGTLDSERLHLLTEWTKASSYLARGLGEYDGSVAARATKAAIGMLTHHQRARDVAATECTALLEQDETLIDALCDARWEAAGFQIAGCVIAQYLGELQRGQK